MPKRTTITAFFSVLPPSQKQEAPAKRQRVEPRSPLLDDANAGNAVSRELVPSPKAIENALPAEYKPNGSPPVKHAPAKAESPLPTPKSRPLVTLSSPGPQSPPSSPTRPPSPPRREPSSSPELFKTRPATFALLRRRAAAASSSSSPRASSCPPGAAAAPRRRGTRQQLTLDLGQKTTLTCRGCGMSYAPAQREDAALHARFHARAVAEGGGAAAPRLAPQTVKALLAGGRVWGGGLGSASSGVIVCVQRADEGGKRRAAETCLRVAEQELGAVEMKAEDLWRQIELKSGGGRCDAHRVFMCLRGQHCVGLLLAERIETARVAQSKADDGTPSAGDGGAPPEAVFASDEEYPALLGIARIWTARSARRTGVALALLEQARRHFLPDGAAVEMDRVAFSQPTQMGAGLARRFFGKKWGWLVYTG